MYNYMVEQNLAQLIIVKCDYHLEHCVKTLILHTLYVWRYLRLTLEVVKKWNDRGNGNGAKIDLSS